MRFPSKKTVECIRKEYPVGTRVELVRMDDPQRRLSARKAPCEAWTISAASWLPGITAAV